MAKKIIKNQVPQTGKINPKAFTIEAEESKAGYPVFSFAHVCHNHCLLSEWKGKELIELLSTFKTMESVPWHEIRRHKGLNYKPIDGYSKPLPDFVSPDVTLHEVKVCKRKRFFGYRAGDVFRVIWFDREHEVCPYKKQRRV